jgi:hypothetical protein
MTQQNLEKVAHLVIAKPISWAIFGVVLAVTYGWRGLVRFEKWLRNRYAASGGRV